VAPTTLEVIALPGRATDVAQLLEDPACIDRGADTVVGILHRLIVPGVGRIDQDHRADRQVQYGDGGQDQLDDGDDAGRLACSRPERRPPEASMRCLALLAMTRATIAPTGAQIKKPAMAITSAAVASPSVCGPGG
jgi:hypothetical protein